MWWTTRKKSGSCALFLPKSKEEDLKLVDIKIQNHEYSVPAMTLDQKSPSSSLGAPHHPNNTLHVNNNHGFERVATHQSEDGGAALDDQARQQKFLQMIEKENPALQRFKVFEPGEAFGEISLITGAKRTGTIICVTKCDFLVVNKATFDVLMQVFKQQENANKMGFLKQYEFFRELPDSKLMSLMLDIKLKTFKKNDLIYQEGDTIKYLYLIVDGQVQLSEQLQFESKVPLGRTTKIQRLNQQILRDSNENPSETPRTEKYTKETPLLILTKNSFFGEFEMIQKSSTRKQKAVVVSADAQLYEIEKNVTSPESLIAAVYLFSRSCSTT